MERIQEQLHTFLTQSPCSPSQRRELAFKWVVLNYIRPFFKSICNTYSVSDLQLRIQREDEQIRIRVGRLQKGSFFPIAYFSVSGRIRGELHLRPIHTSINKVRENELIVFRQLHRLFAYCIKALSQET